MKKHSITLNGRTLNYTTTTRRLPIDNDQGETEAWIFFVAYALDNPLAKRPLMFSFNGGPGSASVWLRMGALGPKIVKMRDDGSYPPPPFELVDNPHSVLPFTDMVFIDPVGTGYSRAVRPELGKKFFGVQGDIAGVGEFIRLWLPLSTLDLAAIFDRRELRNLPRRRRASGKIQAANHHEDVPGRTHVL